MPIGPYPSQMKERPPYVLTPIQPVGGGFVVPASPEATLAALREHAKANGVPLFQFGESPINWITGDIDFALFGAVEVEPHPDGSQLSFYLTPVGRETPEAGGTPSQSSEVSEVNSDGVMEWANQVVQAAVYIDGLPSARKAAMAQAKAQGPQAADAPFPFRLDGEAHGHVAISSEGVPMEALLEAFVERAAMAGVTVVNSVGGLGDVAWVAGTNDGATLGFLHVDHFNQRLAIQWTASGEAFEGRMAADPSSQFSSLCGDVVRNGAAIAAITGGGMDLG